MRLCFHLYHWPKNLKILFEKLSNWSRSIQFHLWLHCHHAESILVKGSNDLDILFILKLEKYLVEFSFISWIFIHGNRTGLFVSNSNVRSISQTTNIITSRICHQWKWDATNNNSKVYFRPLFMKFLSKMDEVPKKNQRIHCRKTDMQQ